MEEKRIILTLDSKTVNFYTEHPFDDYQREFRSSLSLIEGLHNQFNLNDLAFLTPEQLKGDQQPFEIRNRRFYPLDSDLSAPLLIILGVDTEGPDFGIPDVQRQYDLYEQMQNRIGRFMNPLETKAIVDKRDIYGVPSSNLFPELLDSSSWESLRDEVRERGSAVLKHRMGAGGDQVYLVTPQNFGRMMAEVGSTLPEYVAQETLDIISENRVIIYGDQVVASRIAYHRSCPWERTSSPRDGHFVGPYQPTEMEVKRAMQLHEECGLDYSATDFAQLEEGHKILEINGIHPGMLGTLGPDHLNKGEIYNTGDRFAQYLKDESQKARRANEYVA